MEVRPIVGGMHGATNVLVPKTRPSEDAARSPSLDGMSRKRVTRTRSGCLTCRRRKKKCDEQRCPQTGSCLRCKNAGYECQGFPKLRSIVGASEEGDDSIDASNEAETSIPPLTYSATSVSSTTSASPSDHLSQRDKYPPTSKGPGYQDGLQALPAPQISADGRRQGRNVTSVMQQGQYHRSSIDTPAELNTLATGRNYASSPGSSSFRTTSGIDAPYPAVAQPAPVARPVGNMVMPPPVRVSQMASTSHGSQPDAIQCGYIGECILVGRAICTNCLSTIEPLFPGASTPQFALPTPSPSASSAYSSQDARHQPVMQSLIGYYSAVTTCWVEGCMPHNIAESSFFRQMVQRLIGSIDHDEALRLSVAAVASGYIGGGQLMWPEDLVAIQRWTETLRQDSTDVVGVTTSNSSSSSRRPTIQEIDAQGGDRLARHSYIDRHLSKNAMLLYRMARRAVEEAVRRASRESSLAHGLDATRAVPGDSGHSRYISPDLMHRHNDLLLAAVNLCIFSWAEMSLETYYHDFDLALQAVHSFFGGANRLRLAHLRTMDTVGLAIIVWGDVAAAIARGTRPYFELDESPMTAQEIEQFRGGEPYSFFLLNCPPRLLRCLNELARLRFDCRAVLTRSLGQDNAFAPLPASIAQRAAHLEEMLKAAAAQTEPSTHPSGGSSGTGAASQTTLDGLPLAHHGSPNCAEMTRLAALLFLYTSIYGKGPLHPTCKFALQNILHLWSYGAIGFCRAVGCSNYLFPMFMASAVACEARDRVVCEEAMQIVGHNESVADAGRRAIREIWRRTDEAGFPVLWHDVVSQSGFQIAFL